MEGAPLSGLEADLPHSHFIILEQQAGPDIAVAVLRLCQLLGEVAGAILTFFDYFRHAI